MEDIVGDLNSYEDHQFLSEIHTLLKYVNTPPHEFNIEKPLLEDRDGPLSQEAVIASVRNRSDSATSKQEIVRGKKTSPVNQALLARSGTGKPSYAHR